MDYTEMVLQLEEAQEHILNAIELIENVLADNEEIRHYEAYLIDPLRHFADGSGNPYDESIPKLIDTLKKGR
jgi:hypothetical protein